MGARSEKNNSCIFKNHVIKYIGNEKKERGVKVLPNIKSSILSVKTDAKRHAKNVAEKTRVKKASRKVLDAVAAGNADEAKTLLHDACKTIDQAAANHVYHKNNAARKKSRLAKKVNSLAQ